MQQRWTVDELIEGWTLLPGELALLNNKSGPTRLGFAVMLKAFQLHGRFPYNAHEVPGLVVDYMARQIGASADDYTRYNWRSRNSAYQRRDIRDFCGFQEFSVADGEVLTTWLRLEVLPHELKTGAIESAALSWIRAAGLEPPTPQRLERLIDSAVHQFERQINVTVLARLSDIQRTALDTLLVPTTLPDQPLRAAPLQALRTNSEKRGLDSVQEQIEKLAHGKSSGDSVVRLVLGTTKGLNAQLWDTYTNLGAVIVDTAGKIIPRPLQ